MQVLPCIYDICDMAAFVNTCLRKTDHVFVGLSNICYTFAITILGNVLVRRLPVEWRRKIACLFVLQKIYIRYVESH